MLVRECMTSNPLTLSPTDSLEDAMELMAMKHIRHLPVVDAAGKLLGLMTDRDLRRVAPSPLFSADPSKEQEQMAKTHVERIMVRAPATIAPTVDVREAVKVMVEKKYGALPVLEGGKLVGIITPIDVMRVFLKQP